jgi:hypothetical protein
VDPEVILTTRIACARIRGASSVRRVRVAELLGSVGCRKIGGDQWYPQNEKNDGDNVRHCGPRLVSAANPKLRRFESKSRPRLYLPSTQ